MPAEKKNTFGIQNLVVSDDGWVDIETDGDFDFRVQLNTDRDEPQILGLAVLLKCSWATFDRETGLAVGPAPSLDSRFLRSVPLPRLRDAAWQAFREAPEGGRFFVLTEEPTPRGRRRVQADHYAQVAAAYKEAVQRGESNPRVVIAETWGVSKAAASKWIAEARRRQLLGWPERIGKAGATQPVSPITGVGAPESRSSEAPPPVRQGQRRRPRQA